MPMLSTIVDGAINLNLLLAMAFVLWLGARAVLNLAGHGKAFVLQLSLLNWLFAAVMLAPVLVFLYDLAVRQGMIEPDAAPNLTDFFVSQYLSGNIGLSPSTFESALALRDTAIRSLLGPASWFAYGALGVLVLTQLALIARFAVNALRLRRVIKSSYAWRRFGRLHLCLTDMTHVPFSTRGLRNHYIIIPQALLSDRPGLQMAIAHELQHMRQGDVGWEIGLETLRLLFFWNPAFLLWKRTVDRLRELACDQHLLARGRFDPAAYSECLLRICRNGLRQRQVALVSTVGMVQTATPIMGADPIRFLRFRITALLDTVPPLRGRRFGQLLLAPLVLAMALGAVAIQSQGDWSHDRLMLSTIVNLERLRSNQGY